MIVATSTHLVIADDHPLFRDALRQAVASVVPSAKIDEAGSFEDLTALLEQDSEVDLILLDLTMPGISGFSGLIYLRAQFPAIPVVIVSASDDVGTIRRSLDFGASGFIPKRFGVDTLREAIVKVMDGDVWVPPDTDLSSADDPDMTRLREPAGDADSAAGEGADDAVGGNCSTSRSPMSLVFPRRRSRRMCRRFLQKLGVESRTQAVIAAAKIARGQWRQATPSGQ